MLTDCFLGDLVPIIKILALISLQWHRKTDALNSRLFPPLWDGQKQMVYLRAIGGKSPIFDYFLPSAPGGNGRIPWLGQGIKVMLKAVIHKEFLVVPRCRRSTVLPQQAVGLPHFSCSGSQTGACHCWQIPGEYDRGWATKWTPNYWLEFLSYIINAL